MTHKIFCEHQLAVPKQARYSSLEDAKAFLKDCQRCVVKPLDSEQGEGISIDIRTDDELEKALALARQVSNNILLEEYCPGKDLRIIVIGNEVVAAAIRKPPCIFGNGVSTIRTLIEKQSRRRQAATGGESKIPLDDETKRTIAIEGYTLDSILEKDKKLIVRKLANLHTGGTIHDVTDSLHPHLKEVAITAAMALEISVVGLDLLVEAPDQPGYKLIEANERPGLANHEPQPTAERFIDFLFPQTCL